MEELGRAAQAPLGLEEGHTPGPWQQMHNHSKEGMLAIIGNVDGDYRDGVLHHSYDFVASCMDDYGEHEPEAYANARLIAAAPDLLAALKNLVDNVLHYERVNNLAPNPGRKYCWDTVERAVAAILKATSSSSPVRGGSPNPTIRGDNGND